jgi:Protein of unknown function DUF262/Protein of unknown function (DUF1524)
MAEQRYQAASNFSTENSTYRKLIGNGLTYQVPKFQRDYSWTESEWEDLWADILETVRVDGEPAHYMGYLVLQSNSEKNYDVIDGQQRMSTLSLLALAVCKNIERLVLNGVEAEKNQQRLTQIRSTYIGYLDPITLITRSKLTLNRNNDAYYQNYLVPLADLPTYGFRATEHALRKAFEWFDKKIASYVADPLVDTGVALASLIETMSDRLFFTVITVTDELNAFKVFETLNARGVRLSSTDLLKNYLFSVIHRSQAHAAEIDNLELRWETIVSRLGSESLPEFLRCHWNSRNTFTRQAELFKTIRKKVTDRAQVFLLLRNMEEDIDPYLSLTDPSRSALSAEQKHHAALLKMFRVRQPIAFLLAAYRQLDDKQDFATLLRACVVISFRYNTIGNLPPNEQERIYSQATLALDTKKTLPAIFPLLADIYPSDNAFKSAFAEKEIKTTDSRNNKIVRYTLCQLEKQITGIEHDLDSNTFNIEHILPQKHGTDWPDFPENQAATPVFRLGNMTLLSTADNRDLGNSSFAHKKTVYGNSQFSLTQSIDTDNSEWTVERIQARQNKLAKLATAIWRIDQLS